MADFRNTIRWDSVGVEAVKRDYATLSQQADSTAGSINRSGAAAAATAKDMGTLSGSVGGFSRTAADAARSTTQLQVGLAAFGRSMAALAAPAALGGLTTAIINTVGALDDLGDTAQRLGLTTTALQELRDAARRSDADVATLDGSWSKFIKSIGEATQGQGKLNDILEQYNIRARAADGTTRSSIDIYLDLANAAHKSGDATETARIATAMFGKEGIGLATMLAKGATGFHEMADEAHRAGRIIGEDLVEAAGDAQQTYDELLDTLTAKWRTFAVVVGQTVGLVGRSERQKLQSEITALQAQLKTLNRVADAGPDASGESGLSMLDGTAQEKAEARYQERLKKRQEVVQRLLELQTQLHELETAPPKSGYVAPEDADAGKDRAKDLEKALKAEEDWQNKVAEGWIDLYDKVDDVTSDFYKKVAEDARKAGEEEEQALKDRREAIDGFMADLQLETDLIGLSNKERERRIGLMKLEKQNASQDDIDHFNAGIDIKYAKQAAQDAADEVAEVWKAAQQDFSNSWSDLFYGIFNDGKLKFKDLADSIKSIWARTLADLLTLSIQNSFIKPMFEGLFGGMAGVFGGTGAAGTMNAFGLLGGGSTGNSLQGTGGIFGNPTIPGVPGMPPPESGAGGSGGLFGGFKLPGWGTSMIGGGLLGMGLGSMTGSGTGGALGGALGSFLGPVGSLVGSLLGGFIGGLFKSTPRSISSVTTNGLGLAGLGDSYASGLDIKIGQGMGKSVANLLNEFASELDLSLDSDAFVGMVGQRGKKFFYQTQQTDIKKAGKKKYGAVQFETAEEAIAAAVEAALEQGIIDGLSDADKKLLEAAGSVQEGMAKVIDRRNFIKELDFQYMGLTNPLAEQLARLKDWYDEQLKLADEYEADKTKLEAVYAAKRKDLIEQYNEQLYGGLKDFLTSITAGSASPLSPTTRLGLAQGNYTALAAKARSGDQDAIAALQGAAQDYLTAGRDVFASSSGYQSIYQQVVADLSSITGVKNPLAVGAAANNNVAAAVNDNTRLQAAQFERAANQRDKQRALLESIDARLAAMAAVAQRGSSQPTQNGVVGVGTVGWPSAAVGW